MKALSSISPNPKPPRAIATPVFGSNFYPLNKKKQNLLVKERINRYFSTYRITIKILGTQKRWSTNFSTLESIWSASITTFTLITGFYVFLFRHCSYKLKEKFNNKTNNRISTYPMVGTVHVHVCYIDLLHNMYDDDRHTWQIYQMLLRIHRHHV